MTILVAGATDRIGDRVAELLHARRATIRQLSRNPANGPPRTDASVAAGGNAFRAALDVTMAGIDAVFLTSLPRSPTERR